MFSEVQRNYVKQLVLTNYREYPYYVAFTNTNVNNTGSGDSVSFYIILSKDKITATSRYKYNFNGDVVCLAVRSSNAGYTYHSERVSDYSVSNSITINNYEFVYTNAEFTSYSMQPDILATENVSGAHFDGFSIALLIVIASVIFFNIVRGR